MLPLERRDRRRYVGVAAHIEHDDVWLRGRRVCQGDQIVGRRDGWPQAGRPDEIFEFTIAGNYRYL
jgi:hypothetical protein